jgi:maleylacetate reductase
MKPFVHEALPGRVVFGAGSVAQVADEVSALGLERVLLVVDEASKAVGDRIADDLGGRYAGRLDEVRQHVPEELATDARRTAVEAQADGVVTIGGGSATGLGKAIAVDPAAQAAVDSESVGRPTPSRGGGWGSGRKVTLVAVPTTYAGSEMTPIYGVTGQHKQTGRDLRALPRTVVYDPVLTVGMPPAITAASGFNALAHCVEGVYGPGTDPIVGLQAVEGVRALAGALPEAVDHSDDLDARGRALYGAYLAGTVLAVAGTALHHRLCHVLGGTFGLVHGDVNAVVLPHVVAYNAEAAREAMAGVAASLGVRPGEEAAALRTLAERIGAPTSLAALGMPADALDVAAERAVAETGTSNPRPPDVASLRALLQRAFDGEPPAAS